MKTLTATCIAFLLVIPLAGDDSERILTIDHFVRVQSTVPAIAGQPAQLYVRERVHAGTLARGARGADRVVLFVHGAGTPAEVSFDVPYQDYSWMAYLAHAGFDTFSVDMTGYGRSTRPPAMNDPCNLAPNQQALFVPRLIPAPCAATYGQNLTSIASDWADVGAAVDYVRALRGVDRVSLVAWSLGGPRSGGYAARNPQKVNRLVLLAPAYGREGRGEAPAKVPADGVVFNTQSRSEFDANWDRQVGCSGQYDKAAADSVWSEMLASDPVGATWGSGVRRAPQTTSWGWNASVVTKTQTPTLMVAGVHDKQVQPERVKDLYEDLGASQKVMIDLACSSHNAMWEKNHTMLFRASLEWLEKGTINGATTGIVRMGY
ncbi:MAG TPA: alpha/beta fold hydrolase [Vicinamibacterales bacterium]|nr:alpha/beta fold hydrolase [Vicinamibacterales bacterium]